MKSLKTNSAKPMTAKKLGVKVKAASANPAVKEVSSCCAGDGARFSKIFFGLILVLVGLFYLGRNLGFLPDINLNFQVIWPVLIILAGFLLVNRQSRISIIVGVFAALVFMLILTFVVNFSQVKTESDVEAVMPALRHVEKPAATSSVIQTDSLKLNNLTIEAVISSPLAIEGSARGTWFFEGSFPVKVLDESGQELGRGIAQAQSDWMTEDFVPFKATMMFTRPTSSVGSVVLENDNPSGLAQNDQKITVPIRF
ncbi:hypothetical protein COX68_03870 [Candidatus Falkowbacteria bacterium CG_4_10_14_0_2_um_filter_41_15]|uniref:Bacterial spore germination immunoglobulin-like domain-containing protein n=4 Tax=Candidatus Falkowiibacteriota TaxID=1752728 RepID=A0A2G9ZPZ4_9BACT|nr:MAG: hypothetical protein AUJ35_03375 [Candidatus Falkowbacteria bacterium CG1_02_41_21]PIP34418.1 MAG: hypothetical protein COX21_03020 [Candidatus Falkowbacteria bacterium CG23_combo_of_CG06-09_8_20_14_all_41_10]PIZ09952.1 MAG: hypothetical protein COY54_02095 [Candidatus Falkowbacteria bacterium CG_4_10_14_0_8_um_filter_41_36]PJA08807.1 MAG: hypothetical protein COX68_03870 [Candidatus Falkowbacteria bacterium CG_4_10_14_0_2_um_filter_41_15]